MSEHECPFIGCPFKTESYISLAQHIENIHDDEEEEE